MKFEHIGKSKSSLAFYQAHRHDRWELIYNSSGEGTMTVGETQYRFREGTVLLCPPGTLHSKTALDRFEDYYIHFSGFGYPAKVYLLEDDYEKKFLHLIRILYSTYYENRSQAACNALFDSIMALLTLGFDSVPPDTYVQMLQNRIISDFTDPDFQLQDAMKVIPVNGDHLRRRFKKALGMTPHAYLTNMRMEHAKQLLSHTNYETLTVAQAAFRSGYYDPLYFSRAFKKYTGIAPSDWE